MTKKSNTKHILILVSPYYEEISSELLKGAKAALSEAGATYEECELPGALELPIAFSTAVDAGLFDEDPNSYFHGAVALGCVIRGETSHYDIVAGESARALIDIAVKEQIPLGNGILTVENQEQALVRARVDEKNKGRDAARACLRLIEVADEFNAIADDEEGGQ